MAPLFGIYDLRLADAHLGSSLVDQLLRSFVDTLQQITAVLLPAITVAPRWRSSVETRVGSK